MFNFAVVPEPADGLAPKGARPSTGTVTITIGTTKDLCFCPGLKELNEYSSLQCLPFGEKMKLSECLELTKL